jgi:hypothetical protein
MAYKNIYWSKTALTGGAAGALDSIDGTALQDGEVAHVWVAGVLYIYLLDVDSAAAEASPNVISPDTNAGDKRWILQALNAGGGTIYVDHLAESTSAHGITIDGLTLKDAGFVLGSDADGDMYYRASSALARLAKGTALQYLRMKSDATIPEWATNAAILGDGFAGRTLRVMTVEIENGTEAAHIKPSTTTVWNGDTNAAQDNVGKDAVLTGVWSLSAGGNILTLVDAGITGSAIAVICCTPYYLVGGTAMNIYGQADGGGILFNFYNAATGAPLDTALLVDTDSIYFSCVYITG